MRSLRAVTLTLLVAAIAVAGCGSSTKAITATGSNGEVTTRTVPNVHFAKTKFVLHMALAFGAFHRYIYKPLKQGAFKVGSSGRLKALAKAGVAGLFAFHELKQARADALSDGHLRPLADRIDGLGNKFKSLASTLKAGASNSTAILSSAGAVDALSTASQHQGANIKDVTPALGG